MAAQYWPCQVWLYVEASYILYKDYFPKLETNNLIHFYLNINFLKNNIMII